MGSLSGVVEPVGSAFGYLIGSLAYPYASVYIVVSAAGAMFYVVIEELIPKRPKASIAIGVPLVLRLDSC